MTDVGTGVRREAIYRAGVGLFLEAGFERATMREIAQRAEVGLGTIYGYFPHKDAILLTFLDEVVGGLTALVHDLDNSELPPEVRLRRFVSTHLRYLARNATVARLLFVDSQHLRRESIRKLTEQRERYRMALADMVRSAQKAGAFRRNLDPDLVSTAIVGAVGGVILTWLGQQVRIVTDSPAPDLEDVVDGALDMLFYGIARR